MGSSPTGPSGPPVGSSNLGIAPNLGGLLCYAPCCIGLVMSVVVAVVEKQSRFLRFHAFQSLLLHGAALVVPRVAPGLVELHRWRVRLTARPGWS